MVEQCISWLEKFVWLMDCVCVKSLQFLWLCSFPLCHWGLLNSINFGTDFDHFKASSFPTRYTCTTFRKKYMIRWTGMYNEAVIRILFFVAQVAQPFWIAFTGQEQSLLFSKELQKIIEIFETLYAPSQVPKCAGAITKITQRPKCACASQRSHKYQKCACASKRSHKDQNVHMPSQRSHKDQNVHAPSQRSHKDQNVHAPSQRSHKDQIVHAPSQRPKCACAITKITQRPNCACTITKTKMCMRHHKDHTKTKMCSKWLGYPSLCTSSSGHRCHEPIHITLLPRLWLHGPVTLPRLCLGFVHFTVKEILQAWWLCTHTVCPPRSLDLCKQ